MEQRRFIAKSVSLTGTVAAGATAAFVSAPIPTRHRPLFIAFWPSVSATGSKFSIFLTKSPTPVLVPGVGDPPVIFVDSAQFFGANVIAIPLAVADIVEENTRVNVVITNASTSEMTFSVLYIYQEV